MNTTDFVEKRDYSKGHVRLMLIVRVVSDSRKLFPSLSGPYRDSTTPFPVRPDRKDRIHMEFPTGQVTDLFFPRGSKE